MRLQIKPISDLFGEKLYNHPLLDKPQEGVLSFSIDKMYCFCYSTESLDSAGGELMKTLGIILNLIGWAIIILTPAFLASLYFLVGVFPLGIEKISLILVVIAEFIGIVVLWGASLIAFSTLRVGCDIFKWIDNPNAKVGFWLMVISAALALICSLLVLLPTLGLDSIDIATQYFPVILTLLTVYAVMGGLVYLLFKNA